MFIFAGWIMWHESDPKRRSWAFYGSTLIVAIVAVFLWLLMVSRLPFNDDQWIHFQPIFCKLFPFGELHGSPFREPCGAKDLFLFGIRLPLRAYTYIGVGWAAFFLPFWFVFSSPVALHICTASLWLFNSVVLSRILCAPWALGACVVMMSVPVFSQHIVDTGPFSWQFLMTQLSVLLVLRAILCRSIGGLVTCSSAGGILGFLAFEEKAFVVHAIPVALVLFTYGLFRRSPSPEDSSQARKAKITFAVGWSCVTAFVITWGYVNLKMIGGMRYRDELLGVAGTYSSQTYAEWLHHTSELYEKFILRPSSFFHRIYGFGLKEDPVFSDCLVILVAIIALTLALLRKWRPLVLFALSIGIGVANFFAISHSPATWAAHHVVYAPLAVLVGIAIALNEMLPKLALLVWPLAVGSLVAQIPSYVAVLGYSPINHSDPTKQELLDFVDAPTFAREHIVVHLSWGTFFQDSLFGPGSQIVVWSNDPREPAIRSLAHKMGRRIAFLRIKGDNLSEDFFRQKGTGPLLTSSSGVWELWEE